VVSQTAVGATHGHTTSVTTMLCCHTIPVVQGWDGLNTSRLKIRQVLAKYVVEMLHSWPVNESGLGIVGKDPPPTMKLK